MSSFSYNILVIQYVTRRVIANLREMGWGEELDHMASAERHPLSTLQQVKQLRPLTDRGPLLELSLLEPSKMTHAAQHGPI